MNLMSHYAHVTILNLGQVPAELYEAVTIYFSDIVGFTEIAAECTPLEVRLGERIGTRLMAIKVH